MCGILGGFNSTGVDFSRSKVENALMQLQHRGPDDQGIQPVHLENGSLLLAHKRLSIIDLSKDGHQPMESVDKRYTIVFNGEIYNYIELRQELENIGYNFRTKTDTEVLLTAWAEWGVSCINKFDGMFSFVLFDRAENQLYCVRDAFGIKPLYYSYSGDTFLFASEIPALSALMSDDVKPDRIQAQRYLITGEYDVDERTFFEDVKQVLPGSYLRVGLEKTILISKKEWWKPEIREERFNSKSDAADQLRSLFLESVKRQLRSDVPVGAALSGGIDSSAIVCAIREIEPEFDINTFSYIAKDSRITEEKWIDLVNQKVNAVPHKVYVDASNFNQEFNHFIQTQGEPLLSLSYFVEFSVYKLAEANGITVMLDGHGADELLGGYHGYPGERIKSLMEKGDVLRSLRFIKKWQSWPGRRKRDAIESFINGSSLASNINFRLLKEFPETGRSRFYINKYKGLFNEPVTYHQEMRTPYLETQKGRSLSHKLREELSRTGCPPQLRGADRSAMTRSIENRVPFLTNGLAEFMLKVPEDYLISDQGRTKDLFRMAMRGIVPDEILDRKDKIGYETPQILKMDLTVDLKRSLEQSLESIEFLNPIEAFRYMQNGADHSISLSGISWRIFNYLRWVQMFHHKSLVKI